MNTLMAIMLAWCYGWGCAFTYWIIEDENWKLGKGVSQLEFWLIVATWWFTVPVAYLMHKWEVWNERTK